MSASTTRTVTSKQRKQIEDICTDLSDDDEEIATAIRFLLFSIIIGQRATHIAKVAGINWLVAAEFGRRARKNKIWVQACVKSDGVLKRTDDVYCDWHDENDGGMALLLDALTITGRMNRDEVTPAQLKGKT